MSHEPRDPLEGLRPPGAPPELKSEVLAAARAAAASREDRTVWDLLWESRAARTAWAGASLVLLMGHLLLPALVTRGNPTVPERAAAPPELEEELWLPEVGAEAPAFASVETGDDQENEAEKGRAS